MNKFIRCGCDGNDLVNIDDVRAIHYRDSDGKAAIVELNGGEIYELWHEYLCTPRVEDCIVEL